MSSKTCLLILIVVLLCLGFAGKASAEAEAPTLSTGMEWKYSVSLSMASVIGEIEGGFEEMVIEGTVVMTVDSLQTVDVLGSTYEAWVIALDGDFDVFFTFDVPDMGLLAMSAPATCEGLLYLDNQSYEYVRSEIQITSSFSRFSVTFNLLIEIETSLEIDTDTWQFPFDTGSAGITTGQVSSYAHYIAKVNGETMGENETTATYASQTTYDCVDLETVDVEAGSFQAYELDVSSGGIYLFGYPHGYRRDYYSDEVNNSVRVLVYDDNDQPIGEWALESYGRSEKGGAQGPWLLALLLLLILLIALVGLSLRKRSRREPTGEDSFSARRICRRCGVSIPDGDDTCPSCGRAIW